MFQNLIVTDANPPNHRCCSPGTHWIQRKGQQQRRKQVQAHQNGLYQPHHRKPVHLSLSWVAKQTLTHLNKQKNPKMKPYIYCFLWYLLLQSHSWARCENYSEPNWQQAQFSHAALLRDKASALHPQRLGHFLRTGFHHFNQTSPWWHFPSADQYSDATCL